MIGEEKRQRVIWREFRGLMIYLWAAIIVICCDFTVVCYGINTVGARVGAVGNSRISDTAEKVVATNDARIIKESGTTNDKGFMKGNIAHKCRLVWFIISVRLPWPWDFRCFCIKRCTFERVTIEEEKIAGNMVKGCCVSNENTKNKCWVHRNRGLLYLFKPKYYAYQNQ